MYNILSLEDASQQKRKPCGPIDLPYFTKLARHLEHPILTKTRFTAFLRVDRAHGAPTSLGSSMMLDAFSTSQHSYKFKNKLERVTYCNQHTLQ